MSTDWDIYCLDCEEGMGLNNWDHHERDVQDACRPEAAAALAALARVGLEMVDGIRPSSSMTSLDLSFYVKHEGHRLAPRSEYGEILGTCGKDIVCEHCGRRAYERCRLPMGHEGMCAKKP